jgi:outer membrane protein OmpA-like peptidoglycan-associated protein
MPALRPAVLVLSLACLPAVSAPPDRDPDSPAVHAAARAALANAKILDVSGTVLEIQRAEDGIEKILTELGATVTAQEIKIDLDTDVLFDPDKYALRPGAAEMLLKVSQVLLLHPDAPLLIEGHTDGKGPHANNLKLSENRAEAVKKWLVANAGIKASLIRTAGLGDSKPIAPNTRPDGSDNPQGRQKNRRVELTLRNT